MLFDLDGTLLDTLEDLADSMNATLRRLGFPDHPVEGYRYFVGDGVVELSRRVLPADRRDEQTVKQAVQVMREEYGSRWDKKTRPYDGIAELLSELTARGIVLTIFSNKPDYFTKLCVEKLLGKWQFGCVKGLDDSIKKKPDPSGAFHVAGKVGVLPSEFVYLGDTNTDMETAVAAGMYPVGALWGFRSADELLASGAKLLAAKPVDLLKVLE